MTSNRAASAALHNFTTNLDSEDESGALRPGFSLWRQFNCRKVEDNMLWTIFVILLVLWLLGMVSSYTLGGYIHILLVVALVVVLIRVIQGRNPIA